MNAESFIHELEERGIRVSLRGEKVVCSGPQDTLTPDLIETLRQRKPEIREWLKSSLGKDEPTPPPEATPPAPITPLDPAQARRVIEAEWKSWIPERQQACLDEIRRIEAYRRQRGPRPSGPPAKLDRSEVFAAIGAVMDRLGKLWPSGLPTDPQWQDRINEAAKGDRDTFLTAIREWEASETKRVEEYMNTIRETVAGWPDLYRRRFALMVQGFMNKDRGYGLTVPALNPNQAQEKAFNDLLPHVPAEEERGENR